MEKLKKVSGCPNWWEVTDKLEDKINEIVQWINEPIVTGRDETEWEARERMKEPPFEKDSLGCNTLPEKKVYHEDNDRHTVSCIGACRSTLPEENGPDKPVECCHSCSIGEDCEKQKPEDSPLHNHSRGQAGCGECQKEKSYMCYEYIHKKVPCEKCTEVPECLLGGKEKQLFDMVYNWGKVGIVTNEKCNAFQDLIKEIKNYV